MTAAAEAAGVGRRTVYDRRATDEAFRQAWDDVLEQSVEELEREAYRRAMDSSDALAMFLLRARRPKVYSERYRVEHAGQLERPDIRRDLPDWQDKDAQEAANKFLHAVNTARQRREVAEGKLSMTVEEIDDRSKRFHKAMGWDD